ncbi:MAG: sugar phosphate isomerase/epimerase [Dehalococcoidia bacterium]|jgi:sugar phosphate isomerase/epimerase|nr:sugar phosphate isomerase/epimerase [Dehalococcoidia bacterium]MDP6226483.1 sugar phosphate isomerase/epimerase [Dehalococcoidia bacterium]MDP7084038.1 sugar phosphate isomerase/epimerase [Dehalococcoidia bacterium]MDP7200775.1 sugar phosphate isomerase/epimerase [Dehalococcoidia bacterium]MDP7511167.1 sugar phosphate isomerase/epimerase [Dehalococcoidia bacterium]
MSTIAVSTFSFGREAQACDALDFVIRHRFHGLELGSYTFFPQVLSRADRRYLRLQAAVHGVDLSIHFIHRGVAPASHDPARRDRHLKELEDTLELAGEIGARVVVVHPGPIDCPDVAPEDASEEVRREATVNLKDFLRAVVPKAEAEGVVVGMENLHHNPGEVIRSYGELRDLVKNLGSPAVKITLDTGHAYLSDGLTDAFETFAPFLRHIHIHDSDGQRDHLELGPGGVDFNQWIDSLRPYPFALVMETRNEADVEGSVLRSRDHLKRLLGDAAR